MLLDKRLQDRDQIVIPCHLRVILQLHHTGGLAVLPDHDPAGKTISVHVWVVAHIILGHDKGLLSLREHDLPLDHLRLSVLVHLFMGHIMEAHQDIAPVVHLLQDLFKLTLCGHHLVIALLVLIPVKGFGIVYDDRMEEHMGDLLDILLHQPGLYLLIARYSRRHFFPAGKFSISCKEGDRAVIVIAGRQILRSRQERGQPTLRGAHIHHP